MEAPEWLKRIHGRVVGDPAYRDEEIGPSLGWDLWVLGDLAAIFGVIIGWLVRARRRRRV